MGFPTPDPNLMAEVVSDLRDYLRDSKGLNTILCGKVENEDYNLELAIKSGLMWFNAMTPMTSYNLKTLPQNAYIFLIHEAIIEVLTSVGIFHSRNNLAYSSAGLSVNDHDKATAYQGWMNVINSLKQLKMMEKQFKIQQNIEGCYSGMSSEFLDPSRTIAYID